MKLLLSVVLALVGIAACDGGMCACPPIYEPPSVVAWGRVTLENGAPAPGAAISAAISVASSTCVEGPLEFVALVNSDGRYRFLVRKEAPPDDSACVFLRAAYPGEAPPTHEAILGPFRMRISHGPVDSVHADFQLVPLAHPQ
jgi:hypothetical protein